MLWSQAVMDARSVADKLDSVLPHRRVEGVSADVIDYAGVQAGRTPNRVMCNEKLKFGNLINRAKKLSARYVATGHYARLEERNGHGDVARQDARRINLFLFSLGQEQLSHMMFPLGELQKGDPWALREPETAEKQESQEICFVRTRTTKNF